MRNLLLNEAAMVSGGFFYRGLTLNVSSEGIPKNYFNIMEILFSKAIEYRKSGDTIGFNQTVDEIALKVPQEYAFLYMAHANVALANIHG